MEQVLENPKQDDKIESVVGNMEGIDEFPSDLEFGKDTDKNSKSPDNSTEQREGGKTEQKDVQKDMAGYSTFMNTMLSIKQLGDDYDIGFWMNSESLYYMLYYTSKIGGDDVNIKFTKDRVLFFVKGPDNVQYAEVSINASSLVDYVLKNETTIVLEKTKALVKFIKKYMQKDDGIIVKINTINQGNNKAEFHMPDGAMIWTTINKCDSSAKIEKLCDIIEKVRSDIKVEKASAIVEWPSFNKIIGTGSSKLITDGGAKSMSIGDRDIDRKMVVKISPQGLYVVSGDRLYGRSHGITNIVNNLSEEDTEEIIDIDKINLEKEELKEKIDEFKKDTKPTAVQKLIQKSKKTSGNVIIETESTVSITIVPGYMYPFKILEKLCKNEIRIELRHEKPMIIEVVKNDIINALLTIAPRIENIEVEMVGPNVNKKDDVKN